MLIKHIQKSLYCIVCIVICSTVAGSFDDFFIAIRNDNAVVVRDLLERGFDPNTRDTKGQPGLTIAAQERSGKAAKALLAHPSIDVNATNASGESALMMAALKGDIPVALLLLDRGARINQSGWTALHYAATGPEPKLVELLVERGAEIDAGSPNGTTPMMMAAQYGNENSVRLLLDKGADPKRRNQLDLTAVDFARQAGREKIARQLEGLLR